VIEHLRIPTDAGTFDALAAGPADGTPVLLLHGFPQAALQWDEQVGALGAAGYYAVAPDQRGYSPGVRPERVEEYRLDELVADVFRIADTLGWPTFDLVGHDWGAVVAWAAAAERPDRVRSLVALSVGHPTPFAAAMREDEDQAQRSGYTQFFRQTRTAERKLLADDAEALRRIYERRVPQSRVDEYVQRLSEPGALTAALNWYRATKLSAMDVGPITVPTLYLWGTEDVAVGSTAAMATENYVTGPYRFVMLEELSHWLCEEVGDVVTNLLLAHLSDLEGVDVLRS
jgi:pimeloyl-ACP methyl ester carboxylesterase